ncbi:MAG: response regulator [Ramlibacter sp.]|nr:response regulator [Ramlibacter sp.]
MKLPNIPALGPALDTSERQAAASVRSLRILLLLCALLPLALFATFAAYRYGQMHDEAEVRLDRALRIAHEHALKVLEINSTMLAHVIDLAGDAGADMPERQLQLHRQLQALAEGKPQIQSIWVLDRDGRAVASSFLETPPPDLQFGDREYFRWHREGSAPSGLYFSDVLQGRATRSPFFDVSRARRGPHGEFAGVVSVSLRPDYFGRFYADLSANEPGLAITMFRRDGTVYARWPQLAVAAPRMAASSAVLRRVQSGETGGLVRGLSSLDRNDRVILFQEVGNYPVYVGTGMELQAVRKAWLREMALLASFAAVPVLGVLIAGLAAMKRARQAEEAARKLREESQARVQIEEALRQAQKMEAVGRLTGGVAHDFNNALMVISANLHMLKLTQPGVGARQTDAIGRAVDSATKLTRQLLAFSRRQALLPQVLQLQDRLPMLRDLLAPVLGRQVEVVISVAEGTAPVKVDLAELELALLNLAVNAKDAMPGGGGTFRIEAHNAAAPGLLAGPAVVIAASDTGTGIPPEVLARVFEPFFTTKPVGEGTGLGLSQVYGFCQRSGGLARIRSVPGAGTTVEMVLPAIDGPADPDEHSDDAALAALNLRVLLVEDNAEVSAAILPVLEAFGCKVAHFSLAAPAIAWLDAHAGEVDAVLTDVVMPGELDGVALARHVRQAHPQLRLVVMTGYAAQLEEITRQGYTVLAKPWTAANLARALRVPPPASA